MRELASTAGEVRKNVELKLPDFLGALRVLGGAISAKIESFANRRSIAEFPQLLHCSPELQANSKANNRRRTLFSKPHSLWSSRQLTTTNRVFQNEIF